MGKGQGGGEGGTALIGRTREIAEAFVLFSLTGTR